MGNAVAFAGGPIAFQSDRALAVEVGRGLILIEIGEYRRQRLAAVQDVTEWRSRG